MHRPASPALSTCCTTTTTTTCHYYYKMGACDRVRKRCARQVFVEMLLRGLFSSGTSTTPTLLLTFPQSISRGGAAATAFRSAVFCTVPASDDHEGMEKNDKNGHDDDHRKEDSTEHSFGVGYVTRSDEEGFGGVYGGNDDPLENSDRHENHPEYDKSQGSEVKEKEKARNLPEGASATSHSHDQRAAAAEKN